MNTPTTPAKNWEQKLTQHLDSLQSAKLWRKALTVDSVEPTRVTIAGQRLLNFCSNDYLGLRYHPELTSRAYQFMQKWGASSSASRLIYGSCQEMDAIECKLAQGKGTEAALVFNSGFQANASLIPSLINLLGRNTLVFADKWNHASLHLGCQAAGVRQIRFRHNDLDHLEALLRAHSHPGQESIIISETVFSMEGDRVDVSRMVHLAKQYNALLYLDEAHATGIFGPQGFGLSAGNQVDVVMGTFSKALGSFGAYVACSKKMRDFLINRCAGFIYSTALPPAVWGAIDAALDLLPALDSHRAQLLQHAEQVRQMLARAGLNVGASSSQIIPVILGDTQRAIAVAQKLAQKGILVAAIRPPTVPAGQSRIRISLQANHSSPEIDYLISSVIETAAEVTEGNL